MTQVTAEEVGRIVQAQIAVSGNAGIRTLVTAWSAMADLILERLDPSEVCQSSLPLARHIVRRWGQVMPAELADRNRQYLFPLGEVQQLRDVYVALNATALQVCVALSHLPLADESEFNEAVEVLDGIATLVAEALAEIDKYAAQGTVFVTGEGLSQVTSWYPILLGIVLGKEGVASFMEQYADGIEVLNQFVRMSWADGDRAKPN